ncbi:MAG: RNase J family beta-CASP ribonuclease, partial [Ruminococcus sp.]|nr:RNase J family beta-CASP ribonuclease [Ruminococcus sp.]
RESEELMDTARKLAEEALQESLDKDIYEWNAIKNHVKDVLSEYIYRTTQRSPMILPVMMEI